MLLRIIIGSIATLFRFIRNASVIGLSIGIGMLIGCFICNIHTNESYSWISGIWHGAFFIPNFVRYCMDPNILYKAVDCTTMYTFWWWLTVVIQTPTMLIIFIKLIIDPVMYGINASEG